MKRPLRYRTMGAVREGRGNPSPYSILPVIKTEEKTAGTLRFKPLVM